jgi:hypothetical protein
MTLCWVLSLSTRSSASRFSARRELGDLGSVADVKGSFEVLTSDAGAFGSQARKEVREVDNSKESMAWGV